MSIPISLASRSADVAIPTVYNHFPERGELFAACTGLAAAQAQPLGPQLFLTCVESNHETLGRALEEKGNEVVTTP